MNHQTTDYLNSPVKNCRTCAHNLPHKYQIFDRCVLFSRYTDYAYRYDCGLSEWRPKPPKPPKRSLRQWLYDVLWR